MRNRTRKFEYVRGTKGKVPVKYKRSIMPTEEQEQITLAAWLDQLNVLYTASANGGSRHPIEAAKLKRLGVRAGHPDIALYSPRKGYHALFIELKRKDGGAGLSHAQSDYIERLNDAGYLAVCCHGCDEAMEKVKWYLDI